MFGAIDARLLMELASMQGVYQQLPLFETVPEYEIKVEYLCDIYAGWKCTITKHGGNSGVTAHVDHPAFTALRNNLESQEYISTARNCSNGDRVVKEFYLNGHLFVKGDKFFCAVAMRHTLVEGNNKGITEDDLGW